MLNEDDDRKEEPDADDMKAKVTNLQDQKQSQGSSAKENNYVVRKQEPDADQEMKQEDGDADISRPRRKKMRVLDDSDGESAD